VRHNKKVTTAIILAGGLGTRLRAVVSDVPKPMAPICGQPFLAYQLDYWIGQGVTRFIISVGYKHELIVDFFGSSYKGVKLDYVVEPTPLGTGGGLLLALEKLDSTASFLLLNGDTYFAVDLQRLIQFSTINDVDWCFSLFSTNDQVRYLGMDISSQGQITRLNVKSSKSDCWANGGVYWVRQRALSIYQSALSNKLSLENDILPAALSSGQRLFGVQFLDAFIDIGVPEDYYRSADILMA
jgi:D-glycero-alpha-D-manno-heptose 1-phosphate guanylyltransferase